ncbi:MAG: MarR family EPS-associated transcriptional regulator [Candidatus Omnitrophica bacterium]|nr:MarR family EPS-associated transcriptional regulator [Candidatus Omnitrophota bacterium]MDD5081036.1 MarR family EPS-associated transcriptional regulator [Candidatus Omnitrophota bacterium]MDD5441018.1 MarR family EPS-associated transcriptional regulator [Candidatus Omnitrophota bacterium]
MNEQSEIREETLEIIKQVENNARLNQREISTKLKISLGKTNYLIKALINKGFIKVENFSKSPNKANKLKYFLTPQGLKARISLTYYFLKRKEEEYKRLKNEWAKIKNSEAVAGR